MTGANRTLTRRLIAAQTLVVVGMTATIVLVASLVGPAVFDAHMRQAGHGDQPDVLRHAEEAFRSAGLASIGAGLAVAVAGALAVSVQLTRRIGRGLDALVEAANRVAAGHYGEPVPVLPADAELDRVAGAFESMSAQIASTEATRHRLLTDIAHEMRTPIAATDVTLEAIEDGVVAMGADVVATLRAQSGRLARLAADLRDVSAAEEGRTTLTLAQATTRGLATSARDAWAAAFASKGVDLRLEAGADAGVLVDSARMGQVLDNLLANALRHTPPGGRVSIETAASGDLATVAVADDGDGIEPTTLPHVMERFFRGDPARQRSDGSGTGVGLAIARAIVRAHDGELHAASGGAGRGAVFTVTLPSSSNLHDS